MSDSSIHMSIGQHLLSDTTKRFIAMPYLSRRLFSLFALAIFSGTLIACDSSGSNNEKTLPPSEAKNTLQNVDSQLSTNVNDLTSEGPFATTVRSLFSNPRSGTSAKRTQPLGYVLIDELDRVLQTSNGRLDYSASTGEYTWNSRRQTWTSTGPSENVVLVFPTSPNDTTDNGTFTLSSYTDTEVTIDGDDEYLPETIDASLSVDDTDVFSLNLENTSFYDEQIEETQVPRRFDFLTLTAPLEHNAALDSPSKREFRFSYLLQREDENQYVMRLDVNATLTTVFNNIDGAGGLDELSGAIGLEPDVLIEYAIQAEELSTLDDDPTPQQLNNHFSATVRYQDQKVGDIRIATITRNGTERMAPVLVYSDGSQQPLQEVFENSFSSFSMTVLASDSDLVTTSKQVYNTVTEAVTAVF